ncbi:MAG: hypothetical protein ABIQ89_00110 [Candidatus Saccharimonadales bacterium]
MGSFEDDQFFAELDAFDAGQQLVYSGAAVAPPEPTEMVGIDLVLPLAEPDVAHEVITKERLAQVERDDADMIGNLRVDDVLYMADIADQFRDMWQDLKLAEGYSYAEAVTLASEHAIGQYEHLQTATQTGTLRLPQMSTEEYVTYVNQVIGFATRVRGTHG